MARHFFRSVALTLVLLLVCGLIYPVVGWAFAQWAFRSQANGSLSANGSVLIGQPWNNGTSINPLWFNGRPDAENPLQLNGVSGTSGAANFGPRSKLLAESVRKLLAEWRAVGVTHPTSDLVTSSGSGLDPDISLADALVQVPMISRARHLAPSALRTLIRVHLRGPSLGFLGEPTLNVLELNDALAKISP